MEEVKKKLPNIPANYVSLVQLQNRWIEEQQRKQKGKEAEEEKQEQQQKDEQRDPILEAQGVQQAKSRNSRARRRDSHRSKTDSVTVVVEGNDMESNDNEMKRKDSGSKSKREQHNKKKANGRKPRAQEKEEVTVSETQPALVTNEQCIPARREGKKWQVRKSIGSKKRNGEGSDQTVEIEGKTVNVVEGSGQTVEVEGKIENVVEESDQTVAIDKKFVHLSVDKKTGGAERENRSDYRSIIEYTGKKGGVNRISKGYRGYKGAADMNWGRRGYNGGGIRHSNKQYTGSYGGSNRFKETKVKYGEMVWVRKEEVAADVTRDKVQVSR